MNSFIEITKLKIEDEFNLKKPKLRLNKRKNYIEIDIKEIYINKTNSICSRQIREK